ncbi:MAG TPA: helix-turn-helix domain-containing protein [Pyrinomonadaceae bacterium]|nr:helix-turn-helix domain-containing protein [Pyrinomonadaceae bacterium]
MCVILSVVGKAKHDQRQSGCAVAYGLDVFGDKWTLVVVRDMIMWGKRHFNELLACREKIASNILADRLKRLEEECVITKTQDPENESKFIYELTPKGKDLIPLVLEIMVWGSQHAPNSDTPAELVRWVKKDRDGVTKAILESLEKNEPFVRAHEFL